MAREVLKRETQMLRCNMLPPDFKKHYEGGGVNPPHCVVCTHAAEFGRELICLKYGGYVFLYSSCATFRRTERGSPILTKEEVERSIRERIVDLRKAEA